MQPFSSCAYFFLCSRAGSVPEFYGSGSGLTNNIRFRFLPVFKKWKYSVPVPFGSTENSTFGFGSRRFGFTVLTVLKINSIFLLFELLSKVIWFISIVTFQKYFTTENIWVF